MASIAMPRPFHHADSHTRLITLPPEIRAIIYAHLCNNLCLEVSLEGKLRTRNYPWQLSAVSRLLRNEILPILRGESQTYPLRLVCDGGRFPDEIRRHVPNRVLNSISIITILDIIAYDELKPSLTTFPNLLELRLALTTVTAPNQLTRNYLLRTGVAGHQTPPLSENELALLINYIKQGSVMSVAAKLKGEQERPREGLERDYLVDGTLYQILSMDRRRRGFDVKMEADLLGYDEVEYWGYCNCGTIRIDDWDSGRGSHFGVTAEPWRLYL